MEGRGGGRVSGRREWGACEWKEGGWGVCE